MIERAVYPVVLTKDDKGEYLAEVPDLGGMTQGKNLAEVIAMARDLIKLCILDREEDGIDIPAPDTVKIAHKKNAIISYVDVDMQDYRMRYGTKTVKKNCTIPAWLCAKAEDMKINFSKTLQDALYQKVCL